MKNNIRNNRNNDSLVLDLKSLLAEKQRQEELEIVKKESFVSSFKTKFNLKTKQEKTKKIREDNIIKKREKDYVFSGFKIIAPNLKQDLNRFNQLIKNKKEKIEKKKNDNKRVEKNIKEEKSLIESAKKVFEFKKNKKKVKKKWFSFNTKKKEKKSKIFIKRIQHKNNIIAQKMSSFVDGFKLKENIEKSKKRKSFISKLPVFAVVLLFLIAPVKIFSAIGVLDFKGLEERVFNNSSQGFNNLILAADSISRFDLLNADKGLSSASHYFLLADDELAKINDGIFLLASISNDPKLKLASQSRKLLNAGISATNLASYLLKATDSIFSENENFSASLEDFLYFGNMAVSEAKLLNSILSDIDQGALPFEYQDKFNTLSKQVNLLATSLEEFVSLGDKIQEFLGISQDKRYLLVFQNNAEMRASGGFMGSYALVDIREGRIRNLEVPAGGTYDLEAGLMGKRFASPHPLHLVNPLWNFWDANWWPNWPKTANHLMWFYEQTGGSSVDGVISLTPNVVERLLKLTGPIDLTYEHGVIIDDENFWQLTRDVIEQDNLGLVKKDERVAIESSISLEQGLSLGANKKPKKIIGDLMVRIIEKLPEVLNKENLAEIVSIFESSINQKDILFYLSDERAQEQIVKYGLGGELKEYDHDYLMLVDTNIAGQKTDRVIENKVWLDTTIDESGNMYNKILIHRGNPAFPNEPFVGVRNVNWLRVYTPLGSELISYNGQRIPDENYFDEADEFAEVLPILENEKTAFIDKDTSTHIYNEDERTVFANWTMTDPQEVSVIEIEYKLPYNFFDLVDQYANNRDSDWISYFSKWLNPDQPKIFPYSLLLEKQPGAKPFKIHYRMVLPESYSVYWRPGSDTEAIDDTTNPYLFNEDRSLERDLFYGALINKEL